jgi:pimeloyl-ACP methyl ester carboxylesterase
MKTQTVNHNPGCLGWVKRMGLGLLILLVLFLSTGAVWQLFSQQADHVKYPPLGKLVDVDGHAMHIYCSGEGSPTVILEGGVPEWSIHWQKVQPEIAHFTRVCSYDRAGYGWSESGPMPRTADKAVTELHTLLKNAGESAPYVLVAHSLSGPTALLYQHDFPNEVVGLVMIETWGPKLLSPMPKDIEQSLPLSQGLSLMAPLGVVRLLDKIVPLADSLQTSHLSETMQPIYRATYSRSEMWATMNAEYAAMDASGAQTQNLGSLGDLPLVVIRAGTREANDYPPDAAWDANLKDLASLSTRGKLILAKNSGHFVQLDQPRLVVETIHDILEISK